MDGFIANPGARGPTKWGRAHLAGYQVVPDALLVKQRELGLDPTDILVLLNLTSFWWFENQPPYLRTNVIAGRMGVSARTVQRAMRKLETKGYIERTEYSDPSGETRTAVHFDGLLEALDRFARFDPILSARMEKAAAVAGTTIDGGGGESF